MSKLRLTPKDDSERLTDLVSYEWRCEGKHMAAVHCWAIVNPERVDYLLDMATPIDEHDLVHAKVRSWCSSVRLARNLRNGGSLPREVTL